jgi:succinate dehydrogenase / fumarate reductase iron-sulfur subunit
LPLPIVQHHKQRGKGIELHILGETDGTVRCHTAYNWTEACPREIKITQTIGELKLVMVTGSLK